MATLSELDEQIRKQVDVVKDAEEDASTASEKLLVLVTDYHITCEKENKIFEDLVPLMDLSKPQQDSYKRAAKVAAKYRLTGTSQKTDIPISIRGLEQLDRQTIKITDYEEKRKITRKVQAAIKEKGASLDVRDIKRLFSERVREFNSLPVVPKMNPNRKTMSLRLSKGYKAHDLLGLHVNNPPDVIALVCKYWQQKYHPDKGGDPATFTRIQTAIEEVKNASN